MRARQKKSYWKSGTKQGVRSKLVGMGGGAAVEMNLQQAMQPKSSANGFGRRRAERDWGTRFENKVQSGKSHTNRSSNAGGFPWPEVLVTLDYTSCSNKIDIGAMGKVGVYESPSRDRLVYLTTCLIGHPVEVQLKNGSIYSGTCHTINFEKEFSIILKMARVIKEKDVSVQGQKAEFVSKAPSKTLILPGKEVVQVIAKDISVTIDGMSNELQHAKEQEIMIDSFISQSRLVEMGRELEPWIPDEDNPQCPELENIFDGPWNSLHTLMDVFGNCVDIFSVAPASYVWGWDQFETNEMLFGVKSTFDEELYTTKLERGPQMKDLEKEAGRIAREIEGEETRDLHLAEERGIHLHESFDIDEETRFSSVYRGGAIDDGGCEELDHTVINSHDSETFGGPSSCSIKKSADLTQAKSNDGTRVLSSSSLDEAQCSQSSTCADLLHPGSHDHAAQLPSEPPTRSFSTSDSESRFQDDQHREHGAVADIKELVEEQMLTEDAQLSKGENLKPMDSKKKESDKGRLSPNITAYAPSSHVVPKNHEKTSSPGQLLEVVASVKGAGETLPVNSRGRPGSSTSSNSDCAGALAASSGPGLSPSSSIGSLSSEKSTLNPHAKEFKLNPNAKSFTPSQTPARPTSPMSDGSFYFQPNVSAVPHMHGMPVGIGLGPSFNGQQPVIFNQQLATLQTPQAYLHPGGPQFDIMGKKDLKLPGKTSNPDLPTCRLVPRKPRRCRSKLFRSKQ
ncbi:unnamed protein product [Dovyalis caffra]|uniref:LsmAD domain-containing protein n=1 Tax=Dovyalis caffra TaxID=77055 RepID=A0AAV1STL3_9ROSI|nr:unnamed protein product [Dovyalis caffra]